MILNLIYVLTEKLIIILELTKVFVTVWCNPDGVKGLRSSPGDIWIVLMEFCSAGIY